MIVSHEWLRTFVPHDESATEIGDLLSRHCVTLDGLESMRADLADFVVAQVVEVARHPEADRLSVTKVDDGSGTLFEVVCGAPNVTAGHKYPFARLGTVMPDGLVIAKRKIRGVTSTGMLCSARELGLGVEHDGIYTLDTDAAPGTPLLEVLPIGDTRLDLDVLPNRPDLLSHLGVAREVSALTGVTLRMPPELPPLPGDGQVKAAVFGDTEATADGVTVRLVDTESCPRYIGLVIRGVTVGPSPSWLVERLTAVGARSINNVVDATNYVLHGLGQPVHAFDLQMLAGRTIEVRATTDGESLVTLDGVQRRLPIGTTVICDGDRPTALAGIMGGEASEVSESTTDVLLEVAWFEPRFVRNVRRTMNLTSDAAYRFERGVDAGFTGKAAGYAASLIAAVAGGEITAVIDVGKAPAAPAPVRLRASRVQDLLGAEIESDEIVKTLTSLGCVCTPDGDDVWSVRPPTWRHDLGLEVDLIEEVARMVGFDALPSVLMPFRPGTVPDHPLHVAGRRVRDALVASGLAETRPMPFVGATAISGSGASSNSSSNGSSSGATGSASAATNSGNSAGSGASGSASSGTASTSENGASAFDAVRVRNPLADDEPFLRTSLLDTLARRVEYNLSRMVGNVRLFEVGTAFLPSGGRLPIEEIRAAAVIIGASRPPHFTEPDPPAFSEWHAKALAETMVRAAFPGRDVGFVPGDGDLLWTMRLLVDGRVLGTVRRLVLDRPVWAADAFGVELTLGVMPSADVAPAGSHVHGSAPARESSPWASVQVRPLPSQPAASFDLALLVPVSLAASRVEEVLRSNAGEQLESLELFDEFRGEGLPANHRSLGWRLTFRHPERTLREKEIEGRRTRLLQTLDRELGVRPRAV